MLNKVKDITKDDIDTSLNFRFLILQAGIEKSMEVPL